MGRSSNKSVSSILKGVTLPGAKAFDAASPKPWRDGPLWQDNDTRLPMQLYPFMMERQSDRLWCVSVESSKGEATVLASDVADTFAAFRIMLDLYEEYFPKRAVEQVYFIGTGMENGCMIKVGYSMYPEARLKTLQTGHPEKLHPLATTPGGRILEEKYHRRWWVRRGAGEWFYMGDCIRNEIKRLQMEAKP